MVVPGDIVRIGDLTLVVVDVSGVDAVLRDEHDRELMFPIVKPVADLEVVGHLTENQVPGWREVSHGIWEKET